MTPFDQFIENKVEILINGGTTPITDENVKIAVQKRLREIKKNCTEVLKQMKDL